MAEYNTSDIVNVAKNTVSKWEKPGGTTGMIVLGVVVGAIAINITPIMNFIAAACASTLSAIGMAAVLFLVLYCLFDPRIRNIGSTIYFMIMRKIEGLLVDYDPISIVKRKIMQMNNKIQEITDNMGKLRGLIDKSEKRIQHDEIRRKRYDAPEARKDNQPCFRCRSLRQPRTDKLFRFKGCYNRHDKDSRKGAWFKRRKRQRSSSRLYQDTYDRQADRGTEG